MWNRVEDEKTNFLSGKNAHYRIITICHVAIQQQKALICYEYIKHFHETIMCDVE